MEEGRALQVLEAFRVCSASIEEHLHLIAPPIIHLFCSDVAPISVKKYTPRLFGIMHARSPLQGIDRDAHPSRANYVDWSVWRKNYPRLPHSGGRRRITTAIGSTAACHD